MGLDNIINCYKALLMSFVLLRTISLGLGSSVYFVCFCSIPLVTLICVTFVHYTIYLLT